MSKKGPTVSNALLILFPGFNTLDCNGPFETFRQTKYGSGQDQKIMFNVTVAALDHITVSAEGARMERDIPIDKNLLGQLTRYDLLIVPGGTVDAVTAMIKRNDPLFNGVITTFATQPQRTETLPSTLFSICTGALFLGNLGIFNGLYCTTHWGAYQQLTQYNNCSADLASTMDTEGKGTKVQPGIVLPARFVDAGYNSNKVRIISSGGISCGIDASLHIVRSRAEIIVGPGEGEGIARTTAKILDYAYRFTEGVTFGENFS